MLPAASSSLDTPAREMAAGAALLGMGAIYVSIFWSGLGRRLVTWRSDRRTERKQRSLERYVRWQPVLLCLLGFAFLVDGIRRAIF
jgi:hypothetical protein